MAVKCNERCGECTETTCLSYQINQRITEQIHKDNHGGGE